MKPPAIRIAIERLALPATARAEPDRLGALVKAALQNHLARQGWSVGASDGTARIAIRTEAEGEAAAPLAEAIAAAIWRALGETR